MNIGPIHFPIELVRLVLGILVFSIFVGINGFALIYVERKVAGHVQRRPGPFEVGPHGVLQTVADAIKLMGAFLPVFVLFLPLPFGPVLTTLEVDLGLLLILAFAGVNVLAICLAGWSSRNKWSLLGAARAVSQCVAYEIPMLLALLAVAFMEGSLNLSKIVTDQGNWPWQWNVVFQPVAFLIFFVCAVAETNRSPFDLPEAESELTSGFHTEYSGMAFGLFMVSEYSYMVVVCSVASAVFLGGWRGPVLSGFWWFLGKAYGLLLVIMWFRWTYPRVRFDQLLNLNWKWLLPIALLNLLVTAFVLKAV
jgi:NADH-quinone oxidoreductase subunit H